MEIIDKSNRSAIQNLESGLEYTPFIYLEQPMIAVDVLNKESYSLTV